MKDARVHRGRSTVSPPTDPSSNQSINQPTNHRLRAHARGCSTIKNVRLKSFPTQSNITALKLGMIDTSKVHNKPTNSMACCGAEYYLQRDSRIWASIPAICHGIIYLTRGLSNSYPSRSPFPCRSPYSTELAN